MNDVLDDPVLHALRGRQRGLALVEGSGTATALRYRPDVGPFAALADMADPRAWDALAGLVAGPEDRFSFVNPLARGHVVPPPGWQAVVELTVDQMLAPDLLAAPEGPGDQIEQLDLPDVAAMTDLVASTRPGPFGRATVELGGYLGVRHEGRLVAMAGRRFGPPGWREISAVCTHPDHRGRGLSRRLMSAVAAGIRCDGDRAFLHVAQTNVVAAALYRAMGFTRRAEMAITVVRPV